MTTTNVIPAAPNGTEEVLGNEIKVGDHIWSGGYEWVVDSICHEKFAHNLLGISYRWCFDCHWSGRGNNPRFFNDDFSTAKREDLFWTRSK